MHSKAEVEMSDFHSFCDPPNHTGRNSTPCFCREPTAGITGREKKRFFPGTIIDGGTVGRSGRLVWFALHVHRLSLNRWDGKA